MIQAEQPSLCLQLFGSLRLGKSTGYDQCQYERTDLEQVRSTVMPEGGSDFITYVGLTYACYDSRRL